MGWFQSRYNEYVLLAGPSSYNLAANQNRRFIIGTLLVLCSVAFNLYFGITAIIKFNKWPSPLDNYQALNSYPLFEQSALTLPSPPSDSEENENAVVTTLYSNNYASAVALLGHSLHRANTTARMILLYLPERVTQEALCIATSTGFHPHPVSRIAPPRHGAGVGPHFLDQFTKLKLWTLDQIGVKRLAYLDADTLVRRNFDEVFTLPYSFAAVPDVYLDRGFTLGFNAGVMFVRPSTKVYHSMVDQLATAKYPPIDAEQSFLNHFYGAEAVRLPLAYNGNLAIKMRAPKLWDGIQRELRIVHYTVAKPFVGRNYAPIEWDHMEENVQRQARWSGGLFKMEMGWWIEMWEDMKKTREQELGQCRHHHRT